MRHVSVSCKPAFTLFTADQYCRTYH